MEYNIEKIFLRVRIYLLYFRQLTILIFPLYLNNFLIMYFFTKYSAIFCKRQTYFFFFLFFLQPIKAWSAAPKTTLHRGGKAPGRDSNPGQAI